MCTTACCEVWYSEFAVTDSALTSVYQFRSVTGAGDGLEPVGYIALSNVCLQVGVS